MKKNYLIKTNSDFVFDPHNFKGVVQSAVRKSLYIIFEPVKKTYGLAVEGEIVSESQSTHSKAYPIVGILPPIYPEWLGDRLFQEIHNLRFSYIGGAMARGIASAEMVIELGKCGMLGFFGSAGLSIERIEQEIVKIKNQLDPLGHSWGSNLIHSPDNPELEEKIIDLYLKQGVRRISAAAFMNISKNLVYYSCKGLHKDSYGRIRHKNYIFAKISRPEVAKHFMSPAPVNMLNSLLAEGKLTKEEVELAKYVPLSEDIIAESDSGGHTDNRPLNVLFPAIMDLREKYSSKYGYQIPIRIGAAGGLGTPNAIAAAFALGASFVLLGSVHQSCVESRLSIEAKKLLSEADIADVIMAPSADMFELGGKVQVLKRGTLMGPRGNQLYELYNRYNSIEEIPDEKLKYIEKAIFNMPIDDVWQETKNFFEKINPIQIEKANNNLKYKMGLIFRWYLGNSSRWAIIGDSKRRLDYQIWCGPAIGAFNTWVRGSFLEEFTNRKIGQVALNLLEGASFITKAQQLRTYGVSVPHDIFFYKPIPLKVNL